jgi:predicted PurR-regulated permease PerM
VGGTIAGRALGFVGGIVGAIVQIFFVIFTMYYLFRDGERFVHALPETLPLKREQSERIFARTRDVIGASVYGVLVIATIQGALGGLMFWLLGLPSAIVWAVVMTFLSMIPMAGSFVVWVPAAIYLALTGHWGKALILVVWGALVIGTVDNFLRPKLVGERTKLHELFIFFAVLGGLQVFGVVGIVLGPVVLAITLALLDVFRQTEQTTEEAQSEPTLVEEAATGGEA